MLGGIKQIKKNIKDLYDLSYNEEYFGFFRVDPNFPLVEKGDFEKYNFKESDIDFICFIYKTQSLLLFIPYSLRKRFQSFLNSGDILDIPTEFIGESILDENGVKYKLKTQIT